MSATYKEAVITTIGDIMRNDNVAGEPIKFSRMAIGFGTYATGTDLTKITGLKDEFLSTTMPILRKVDDQTTFICGVFKNVGLLARTPVTEIGLFALDSAMNEELFAYVEHDTAGDTFYIPAETSFPNYSVEMKFEVKSINVDKIEITRKLALDPSEIGIDIPQIPEAGTLRDIIDIIIDAITPKFY